jgi:hypothetical protein
MVTGMGRLIRFVAIAACAVIVVGFMAFASDEANKGSKKQVERIDKAMDAPAPAATVERAREKEHGKPRELIDDANDVLLKPFADVTDSKDVWVNRLIPTVLGLLAYGLGLTLLANFLPKRSHSGGDWRTAPS